MELVYMYVSEAYAARLGSSSLLSDTSLYYDTFYEKIIEGDTAHVVFFLL